MEHYYHLFANGDDAKDFIVSIDDFKAAFNRFGLCASRFPNVKVLAFSIEDSHPHALLYGTFEDCLGFKILYEQNTYRYIIAARGGKDRVCFELELSEINDADYLRNAASYVIVQPTKDGKQIMPYDYRWGTGSMYFRPEEVLPIWRFGLGGEILEEKTFGSFSYAAKRRLIHSTFAVPASWLVCDGLLLPSNYLAKDMYEAIFGTCNCFRTFMSAGRKQLQPVVDGMVRVRGITMPDLDARNLARRVSFGLFGKQDARWLTAGQRLTLARELRFTHHLSIRQIATLSRLPEAEIRKYIR